MRFQTVDLAIEPTVAIDPAVAFSTAQARIEVQASPVGEAAVMVDLTVFGYEFLDGLEHVVQWPDKMTNLLGQESSGRDAIRVVGQTLFNSSLGAWGQLPFALGEAAKTGAGLRIRIRSSNPMVAAQPWEIMFSPNEGGYLALLPPFSFAREPLQIAATPDFGVTRPLRVLLCAARPTDMSQIAVHEEVALVQSVLSGLGGAVEARVVNGTYEAVAKALASDGPWHIFHFAGHGGFDPGIGGVLCFERDSGTRDVYDAATVATLLAGHEPLRLAVLNACRGAMGASRQAIDAIAGAIVQQGTPSAITMQFEVSDTAALPFAGTFYRVLLERGDVEEALHAARSAVARVQIHEEPENIVLEGLRSMEWVTPVFHLNAPDAMLFATTIDVGMRERRDNVDADARPSGAVGELIQGKRLHWQLRYVTALAPDETMSRIEKAFRSTLELRKLDVTPNGLRALSGGISSWAPTERLEASTAADTEGTLVTITCQPNQTILLDQGRNKQSLERIAQYLGLTISDA